VPVYVALKAEVFDVSGARHAYGKEGGYHQFAGAF
jgi:predicted heme/steroid binding protein